MSQLAIVPLVYYGKIVSRGDFVRSPNQSSLTQMIDRWLTLGVEQMAGQADWKSVYDHARPTRFAFLGVRTRIVMAGHLIASTDASGRRFPFVTCGSFEVGGPANHAGAPLAFMARGPMALAPLWARFSQRASEAVSARHAGVLVDLQETRIELDVDPRAHDPAFEHFIETQTVASLESALRQCGHALSLRDSLVALGILLRPVPASGSSHLDKGLSLPLPGEAALQSLVATFWLSLVSPFLTRGDFEVALFLDATAAAPTLRIGFSGGSPSILQAVLDPKVGSAVFLDLNDASWIAEQSEKDYVVNKLCSQLARVPLSLKQASAALRECLLGE